MKEFNQDDFDKQMEGFELTLSNFKRETEITRLGRFVDDFEKASKAIQELREHALRSVTFNDDLQVTQLEDELLLTADRIIDGTRKINQRGKDTLKAVIRGRVSLAEQLAVIENTINSDETPSEISLSALDNTIKNFRHNTGRTREFNKFLEHVEDERKKFPPAEIPGEFDDWELLKNRNFAEYMRRIDLGKLDNRDEDEYKRLFDPRGEVGLAAANLQKRALSDVEALALERELDQTEALLDHEVASGKEDRVTELRKIQQLLNHMIHEDNIQTIGRREAQSRDLRKYFRPSYQNISARAEGRIIEFEGNFAPRIRQAEALGWAVANAIRNNQDPAQVMNEDSREFLNELIADMNRYRERQTTAMIFPDALDSQTRQEIDDYITEVNKYVSWLYTLRDASGTTATAAASNVDTLISSSSAEKLFSVDVESLDEEQTFKYGKQLLSVLNDGNSTYMHPGDEKKSKALSKHKEVQKRLGEFGDRGRNRAEYLAARLEVEAATWWASTSGFTMKYDKLKSGGDGWAGVPASMDQTQVMTLLEGSKFDKDNITDPEEKERVEIVQEVLNQAAELFGEASYVTEKGVTYLKKGPFHATQDFNPPLKKSFKEEVKKRVKASGKFSGLDFSTPERDEALELGLTLMIFIDMRTYYALPFLATGWSPTSDGIQDPDSIKATVQMCNPYYANMYAITGKTEGFVNFYRSVHRASPALIDTAGKDHDKINNISFSDLASQAWWDFYAPFEEDIIYELPPNVNPVPTLTEAMWRPPAPKWMRERLGVVDLPVPDATYKAFKASAGASEKVPQAIGLDALLSGIPASRDFAQHLQKASVMTGDAHKDVETIKKSFSELAKKFSPTKSIPTIDMHYVANLIYNYSRMTVLDYDIKARELMDKGQKSRNDYWEGMAEVIEGIRAGIANAPTLTQIIPLGGTLTEDLTHRYHMHIDEEKHGVRVMDYVLALLPHAGVSWTAGGSFSAHPMSLMYAVDVDPLRLKNNESKLKVIKGDKVVRANEWGKRMLRGGKSSRFLRSVDHLSTKDSQEKWRSVAFPSLEQEKEQKEG